MSTAAPHTLGEDLELDRRVHVDKAIERAMQELTRAAQTGRHDTEEALARASAALSEAAHSFASDVRRRSVALTVTTTREVRDHPMLTAAILTGVFAAAAGLVLALVPSPRHFRN